MSKEEQKKLQGNYANFKGVMLCSRPQNKEDRIIERPYCFRVTPPDAQGLCPAQNLEVRPAPKSKALFALLRHKKWLKTFQHEIEKNRQNSVDEGYRNEMKKMMVRQKAQDMRNDIRTDNFNNNPKYQNSFGMTQTNMQSKKEKTYELNDLKNLDDYQMDNIELEPEIEEPPRKKTEVKRLDTDGTDLEGLKAKYPVQRIRIERPEDNDTQRSPSPSPKDEVQENIRQQKKLRKKPKPAFAMTEAQADLMEDEECDGLMDFFDNADYDTYIHDLEVKNMLESIKKRVEELKQEDNWKQKWHERLATAKPKKVKEEKPYVDDDDMMTHHDKVSKTTGGNLFGEVRSVASEKTKESIDAIKDQIRVKKESKPDWDYTSKNILQNAQLEERMAKHIADELLRNNMALHQIHSNQSVRRIMDQLIKKELHEGKPNGTD